MDGPNASRITPTALDRWEDRLEDVFRGQPYDMLDAALADTVTKFPVDIQVIKFSSLVFVTNYENSFQFYFQASNCITIAQYVSFLVVRSHRIQFENGSFKAKIDTMYMLMFSTTYQLPYTCIDRIIAPSV